ncbi:MAG TPA: cytochrome c [Candidatus Acidoferrales bacterium]|nr:cytochrome c [Candidatus Acidoferrales bacterium]
MIPDLNPGMATSGGSGCGSWLACVRRIASLGVVAVVLTGCRLDMHIQPKYLPYEPTTFFADGRSERQPVAGTIARGHLRLDELFYTGRVNGVEVDEFPFPITRADLERGRERFNIYCTPCHDYVGNADGMIVQRGFPLPASYNIQRLREAPAGHFYGVITNGFGAMYSYADRIDPADRWRIVAYIRVLQLAQNAHLSDVPEPERQKLQQEEGEQATPEQAAPGQPPAGAQAGSQSGQPQ